MVTWYIIIYVKHLSFQVSIAAATSIVVELPSALVSEYQPDVPGISDRRTGLFSFSFNHYFSKYKIIIILRIMFIEYNV